MKFFLVHQYSGNKGDRAVLYAMCRLIKSEYPNASISVATSDSNLWEGYNFYKEEGIEFTPWGWDFDNVSSKNPYWKFLNKIKKYTFTLLREAFLHGIPLSRLLSNPVFYRKVKDADFVVSVGGHHFTTILSRDLVSGINYDATCVASTGKKLICFSQSFGPFDFHNKRNEILTKKLMEKSILMPREEKSEEKISEFLGNDFKYYPTYESVLSISKYIDYIPVGKRENIVGISIYCTQYRTDEAKIEYQNTLAEFCNHVIKKGYCVKFFPMEIKGSGPDDRPFISEIISRIEMKDNCEVVDKDLETIEHLKEVSKCKIFVGHKTHSNIFALATGTPLIGIAYHPKTIEFLRQFGIPENAIDDKDLSTSKLCAMFDNVANDPSPYSKKEYETAIKFAQKVISDFKQAINTLQNPT